LTDVLEKLEEKDYESILEARSRENMLYSVCIAVDSSYAFSKAFIPVSIIANFIVLALDTYPSDLTDDYSKELANTVFYFIFLFEMTVKMIGNGFKLYFGNSFNIFDFVVIMISTLELAMSFVSTSSAVSFQAIRALRVFRLLRMFKLAKFWTSFNQLINLLFELLGKIGFLTCILILFWLSFAILGKELFAFNFSFDEHDVPVVDDYDFENHVYLKGVPPDFNFDNFLQSLSSVFVYFTNDGWSGILHNALRMPGVSPLISLCFFFALYIVGNLVTYQLFRAILLREFDQTSILRQAEKKMKRD
jgi:hypothetical protein